MTLQQLVMLGLPASIILTVFGFGLRATVHDLEYLFRRPALLVRSLLAMLVAMPIVAIAIDRLFDLRPSVEIVLVALAFSPVPPLLPGKERKAGGQSGYALGLMAVAALLAIVTVPVSVWLLGQATGQPYDMSPAAIAGVVAKMMLLPLAAGLTVRALAPAFAQRSIRPLALTSTLLLALAVIAILASALPAVWSLIGGGTLVAMAAFVVIGLGIGHWLGGPHPEESAVLALSTACRHPAIALALAKANFPNEPLLGATVLLYLLVVTVVTPPYVRRRRHVAAGATRAA
jgi:BASS family bile acid:Na+ symporter